MIILTTLYNSENYIERCIGTMLIQTHKDFKCYITDDMSTDNSVKLAKEMTEGDDRFIIIENSEKKYQPGNYDQVIRDNPEIDDNDICVELDGDDWLPDRDTLKRVFNTYSDSNVWVANGSFKYANGANGFSQEQKDFNNLRNGRFTATHMRTWRAFLWRKIKQEDLKDSDGVFWKMTGDLSFMFPMLEMAGKKHYKFMSDINYVYNADNPINDHKVDLTLVNEIAVKIRNMKPYKRIII